MNAILHAARGVVKRWGPSRLRRAVWDAEFADGAWRRLDTDAPDFVYPVIARYLQRGALLDLGCGFGTTGRALPADSYTHYVGVDLSAVAITQARVRAEGLPHTYVVAAFDRFTPTQRFNVILFRESLYYVPLAQIGHVLGRYAQWLTADGVFVIRICDHIRHGSLIQKVMADLVVVERIDRARSVVLVCRPLAH